MKLEETLQERSVKSGIFYIFQSVHYCEANLDQLLTSVFLVTNLRAPKCKSHQNWGHFYLQRKKIIVLFFRCKNISQTTIIAMQKVFIFSTTILNSDNQIYHLQYAIKFVVVNRSAGRYKYFMFDRTTVKTLERDLSCQRLDLLNKLDRVPLSLTTFGLSKCRNLYYTLC